jgi:hypothetical protein
VTATPTAAELVSEAHAATTYEELDAIEAQAEGRVTVINAVHDRRDQLAAQGVSMTEQPLEQPVVSGVEPTPASPQEVLDAKPNIESEAKEGPHPQISPNTYVEMTKPNGDVALVPLSNVPDYEARGLTKGSEIEIEDLSAYWAEKAATEAPA